MLKRLRCVCACRCRTGRIAAAQQNEAAPPAERAAAGVGFRVVARSTVPVRGIRTMQWRGRADSESDSPGEREAAAPSAHSVSESARVGRFGDETYSETVEW